MHRKVLKDLLRPPARIGLGMLSWLESKVSPEYRLQYSPTFILGPPRSGSTLLYQLVAYALSTSYFTNLTGRLRAGNSAVIPVFGARLTKAFRLVEHRCETFENRYGYGQGLGGPHPGVQIWKQWFPNGYVGPGELSVRDRRAVYQAVVATERILDRPFVNKEQAHSTRIQALVEIFPQALFIQCVRDPLSMAQSIYRARTQDFPYLSREPDDPTKVWFSLKPKEYISIKDKGLIEQVCEQVYFTEQNIAAERAIVGAERFHVVDYKDTCQDPRREIVKIAEFMNAHGAPTQIIRSVPASFEYSCGRKLDDTTYLAMADYLEKLYGRPMEIDTSKLSD